MIGTRFLLVSSSLLFACSSSTPQVQTSESKPAPQSKPASPKCVPGFVGHLISENVNVAVDSEYVYWHEYNFGKIQRRARIGGKIETVLPSRELQHNSEGFLLAGGFLYWSSKSEKSLYRIPKAGGEVELLLRLDSEMPVRMGYAHKTLYTETFGPTLHWLGVEGETAGQHGSIATSESKSIVFSTRDEILYVGVSGGIQAIVNPATPPHWIHKAPGSIVDLVATSTTLWWISKVEDGEYRSHFELWRKPLDGEQVATKLLDWQDYVPNSFASVKGGILIGGGNVLIFVGDDVATSIPVAVAPADITNIAASGGQVFVGTMGGSVHQLCPDLSTPIELEARGKQTDVSCPPGTRLDSSVSVSSCTDSEGRGVGPRREWYASGHLKTYNRLEKGVQVSESFYANGSLDSRWVGSHDNLQEQLYYFANGQLSSRTTGGPDNPITTQYNLDGSTRTSP